MRSDDTAYSPSVGMQRVRDNLLSELRELNKSKPRGKADENIEIEINRLESDLAVTKDDLQACQLRLDGIKDELKHVERELRRLEPELRKACYLAACLRYI